MKPHLPSETAAGAIESIIAAAPGTDALGDLNCRALVPVLYLAAAILAQPLSSGESVHVRIAPVSLPAGSGIGSSAALCVAAAGALLGASGVGAVGELGEAPRSDGEGAGLAGQRPSKEVLDVVNAWAFAGETIIHGRPSGLDNTVSCFGGAISYVKEPKRVEPLARFPPLDVLLTNTNVSIHRCYGRCRPADPCASHRSRRIPGSWLPG